MSNSYQTLEEAITDELGILPSSDWSAPAWEVGAGLYIVDNEDGTLELIRADFDADVFDVIRSAPCTALGANRLWASAQRAL